MISANALDLVAAAAAIVVGALLGWFLTVEVAAPQREWFNVDVRIARIAARPRRRGRDQDDVVIVRLVERRRR